MIESEDKFNSNIYSETSLLNNNNNISNNNVPIKNSPPTDKSNNFKHFICKRCNTVPLLKFKSYTTVYYKCKCHELIEQSIEKILYLNIYDERMDDYTKIQNNNDNSNQNNEIIYKLDKKIDENPSKCFIKTDEKKKNTEPHLLSLKCIIHKEIFAYFCFKCDSNVCRKCLSETPVHIEHEYEDIEIFVLKFNKIDKIIEYIKEDLEIKGNESDEIKRFKELMKCIIDDYKIFPNHSHFSIIESCSHLLQNNITEKDSAKNNNNERKNFIFIKNFREFRKYDKSLQNIKKIIINKCNKTTVSSMGFLNLKLINLVELDLRDNNIKCIKALANNKMENLEILNLAINEIDDSNKNYFFQLDFPKLKNLNLYLNRLTDPEILKFKNDKNKLPNLELFYIGNNKFKFNEINTNINDKYEFFSLKEIGISRNFFNF